MYRHVKAAPIYYTICYFFRFWFEKSNIDIMLENFNHSNMTVTLSHFFEICECDYIFGRVLVGWVYKVTKLYHIIEM